jgi:Ni,Fe-hydrogenase III small subunit
MAFWFWYGLRKGIRSTRYPRGPESSPGISPGRPLDTLFPDPNEAARAAANCPTSAIIAVDSLACVEFKKCVFCQRCHFGGRDQLHWDESFEWTQMHSPEQGFEPLPHDFAYSLHIIVVDAGDCGACLNEVKQLNNPLYNMHRLGFFFTPTPRAADVLLVVGPVSENMRGPLIKTYEAMPDPKRVISVGACAITGGVFGQTFASAGGAGSVIPVDLEVPGDPPPPLSILHGLLVVTGRKPPIVRQYSPSEGVTK